MWVGDKDIGFWILLFFLITYKSSNEKGVFMKLLSFSLSSYCPWYNDYSLPSVRIFSPNICGFI